MPELLLIVSPIAPPETFGSGKFGTPCDRMHAENLRAHLSALACAAGSTFPPFGRYFEHADCACLNWGEFGLSPLPPLMVSPPLLSGSGKFGTPFFRMHEENA